MFDARERESVAAARVGRAATAGGEGRPHAAPVCFAFAGVRVVTPIDEKPTAVAAELRRSRDVRESPRVALVVDHYVEDWSRLGRVQVRGTATRLLPRPVIAIGPGSVRLWGTLDSGGSATDGSSRAR